MLLLFATLFNKRARLWIRGRKDIWQQIMRARLSETQNIWFHVASLGEFEQARPLIEKIYTKFPDYKIILTFFSPSGYEVREDYEYADYVWYLPLDTRKNAKKFLEKINPEKVFFVKYDFWYFYLEECYKNKIETYLVSGIFRPKQIFFKKIGKSYAEVLTFFTHLFVQDEESARLLDTLNIKNYTVTGDTRFDRVIQIAEKSAEYPKIVDFINDKFTIIAGSSWEADERLLFEFINKSLNEKFIIAPHIINDEHIVKILQGIVRPVIRYSKIENQDLSNYQVLIIDNMGMLSSIYKYAQVAYIGGGFGSGIHNIIEAAVFGMPIIFGKNYHKFNEAIDLIELKAAYSVKDVNEIEHYFNLFIKDENFLKAVSEKAKKYVYKNKGATEMVMKKVFDI